MLSLQELLLDRNTQLRALPDELEHLPHLMFIGLNDTAKLEAMGRKPKIGARRAPLPLGLTQRRRVRIDFDADSVHEVCPRVFICSAKCLAYVGNIEPFQVSHLVNVGLDLPQVQALVSEANTLHIQSHNTEDCSLFPHFSEAVAFITKALAIRPYRKHAVLISSPLAVSRGPAIALAFIMAHMQIPLEEAWAHLRARRAAVMPNDGFMRELRKYEDVLRKTWPPPPKPPTPPPPPQDLASIAAAAAAESAAASSSASVPLPPPPRATLFPWAPLQFPDPNDGADIITVLDGLFLGSLAGALDVTAMKRRNITRVLSIYTRARRTNTKQQEVERLEMERLGVGDGGVGGWHTCRLQARRPASGELANSTITSYLD